ncbi:general substrate transporter [Aspergillus sergii]|uniref:General substrate transporter n=1 Tax=Aspergillus sergii TaxID=1034303 RepID=A0A5N6XDU7_9EURO|nr:general substrate transporter [Aspergillus sergii]
MRISRPEQTSAPVAGGKRLLEVLPSTTLPWWRVRHLLLLNLTLLVPFVSQSVVGFDGSMMNGLQSLPQWRNYFNHPSSSILGSINAVYPVGKILGLFSSALIGDRFGRRIPFYEGLFILLASAAIQGAAQNIAMFIASRLLIGFGTGCVIQTCPIIVSELSYPTHRGRFVSLYFSTYYMGSFLAAWITYGTFRINNTFAWRIPSILQAAIPLLQACVAWVVPESPRWLMAKGRVEEARQILVQYHAGGDDSSPLVAFEMEEIQKSLEEEAFLSKSSYLDLFRTTANRKRTIIAAIVGFYGSWAGNSVISYYLSLVLNTIGIEDVASQTLINALLQLFSWLCAVFAGAVIDRVGRRPMWLISAVGMCLSFVLWTVLSSQFDATKDKAIGRAVLAFIFIYTLFFTIGISPMSYAYPIELYQYTLRGRGLSFSNSITMCGLILGMFVNPMALTSIGWRYYIVFCVLLGLMIVLVYFLFPETKGRTLEEIAEIFDTQTEDIDGIELKSKEVHVEYAQEKESKL